ncbi:MAG: polysaccharide biosynthesis C-terminal domain-containing protein [Planctomycetota bacterium]
MTGAAGAATDRAAARRHGKRAAVGSVWLLLAQVPTLPLGLTTLWLLTQWLEPAAYGRYATVVTLLMWAEWGVSALVTRTTMKLVADASDAESAAGAAAGMLRVTAGLAVVVGGGFALLAGPIAGALGDAELAGLILLAAIDVPLFALAQCYCGALNGNGRYLGRALAGGLYWPVRFGVVAAVLAMGGGAREVLWALIAASAVQLGMAAVMWPIGLGRLRGARWPAWRWLVRFALPLAAVGMSMRLGEGLDLVMLQAWGGASVEAGPYALAVAIGVVPGMAVAALVPTLLTLLTQLRRDGHPDLAEHVTRMALQGLLWLAPLTLAVSLVCEPVVVSVFGEAYRAAGPVVSVLAWAAWLRFSLAVLVSVMTAYDRPVLAAAGVTPMVGVMLVAMAWAIPAMGERGAALSTVAGLGVAWVVMLVLVCGVTGARPGAMAVARALVATGVAGVLGWWWPGSWWAGLALLALVAGLSAGCAWWWGDVRWRRVRRVGRR